MRHDLYGINEGSWANITSLYSYMFHYNYFFDVAVDMEVLYPEGLFDKELRYLHWEQEETWLEQADFVYNLFQNKPPHNNKIRYRQAKNFEEYKDYKRHRYSYNVKRIKVLKFASSAKDVNQQNPWAMVWPIKNNLTRFSSKAVVSRPSGNIESGRKENKYDWDLWIDLIKKNYDVFEIDYRTPIREAMYHLATSEFYFCATSGMGQQLSVGLGTPTLIMGGFKPSGVEQFERFVPKEDFDRCGDKGYIDYHVEIAKETVNTLIPSLEMIGAF